jgi:hypothetical protein
MIHIYILKGTRPERAEVMVYELDHETTHCLYLKVHGRVIKKNKGAFDFRWFRSVTEATTAYKEWVAQRITELEKDIETLRAIDELAIQIIPAKLNKHKGDIKL